MGNNIRVVTSEDRKAEIHRANAVRTEAQSKLDRLVAYVKEMAKQHNELEKRVEALERLKQ